MTRTRVDSIPNLMSQGRPFGATASHAHRYKRRSSSFPPCVYSRQAGRPSRSPGFTTPPSHLLKFAKPWQGEDNTTKQDKGKPQFECGVYKGTCGLGQSRIQWLYVWVVTHPTGPKDFLKSGLRKVHVPCLVPVCRVYYPVEDFSVSEESLREYYFRRNSWRKPS